MAEHQPGPLVLGIDGGGTKTLCLVANTDGCLLGEGAAGLSNLRWLGVEAAGESLARAADEALRAAGAEPGRVAVAYMGLAGIGDRAGSVPREEEAAIRAGLGLPSTTRLLLDSDAAVALAGATAGKPGVVVIAGTGSIAFGMDERGRRARAGGWGWLIGDEGSGFDLARRALAAVTRSLDGRGEPTRLTPMVLEELGISGPEELVEALYGREFRPDRIATLAPLVVQAAEEGDAVAGHLLACAGRELACAAIAVATSLGLHRRTFEVAFCGGALRNAAALRRVLADELRAAAPGARLIAPRLRPVEGAVLLALRHFRAAIQGRKEVKPHG